MAKKNGESERKPTRTPARRRTDKSTQAAPASAPDTARAATPRAVPASTDAAGSSPAPAAPASASDTARAKTPVTVSMKGAEYSPSPEEVQRRAFELYLQRGGGHGRDLDDWYEAERQLRRSRM
jgi:hypothetical protein